MKQITIDELIPLMKDGYVCLDCHYRWFHFSKEPKLNEEGGYWHNGGKCTALGFCFRIKRPHLNWKKSLRRVANNEIQAKKIADYKIQSKFNEMLGIETIHGIKWYEIKKEN